MPKNNREMAKFDKNNAKNNAKCNKNKYNKERVK